MTLEELKTMLKNIKMEQEDIDGLIDSIELQIEAIQNGDKKDKEPSKAQEEVLQYKHQIIQFMINEGDSDDKIQRATGLSLEEIAKVRSGMSE